MSELPVACTLSSDALAARRQGLLAELLRLAQSHEETKEDIVCRSRRLTRRWG